MPDQQSSNFQPKRGILKRAASRLILGISAFTGLASSPISNQSANSSQQSQSDYSQQLQGTSYPTNLSIGMSSADQLAEAHSSRVLERNGEASARVRQAISARNQEARQSSARPSPEGSGLRQSASQVLRWRNSPQPNSMATSSDSQSYKHLLRWNDSNNQEISASSLVSASFGRKIAYRRRKLTR